MGGARGGGRRTGPPPARVLVVSHRRDAHTRAVLAQLARRRVEAVVFDTASFPERARLRLLLGEWQGWRGALERRGGAVVGEAPFTSAWWRRPEPLVLHRSLGGGRHAGAYYAAHTALQALWSTLPARWVNDPARQEAAEEKPRQLAAAAALGLRVPRSLVTNDPAAAVAFIRERAPGDTIHKNVASARSIWRPTRVAREDDPALLGAVRHLPLLLQERIEAEADVRVTFVGGRAFAAEIAFPRGRPALDWRMAPRQARVRAVRLPARAEARLRALVAALGLAYAAVDLRRTADEEFVFLEVNPSGQWRFVEERTGQPITSAVAALLAGAEP